jgi:anti-anti-sigma factor
MRNDPPTESSSSPFAADLVSVDGHVVLIVRGEIDPATADRFAASIRDAFTHAPRVVIDLRDVVFMDSTGLRALIDALQQHTEQTEEALVLRAPSDPVLRLLTITGLDQLFPIEPEPVPHDRGAGAGP